MRTHLSLRKSDVLRGYRSFTSVITSGRMLAAKPVRLYYVVDSTGGKGLTVGFAVARAVRGAVLRNRIKRLLREAFRQQSGQILGEAEHAGFAVRSVLMFVGHTPEHPGRLGLEHVQAPVGEVLERLSKIIGNRR